MRNVYELLPGKPARKIPVQRPRYNWEDKIQKDFNENGLGWNSSDIVETRGGFL
jgi:hypothetical protein